MKSNKTFLAIIPARGGSKRLPHKNTLDLNGRPLISYTIEAALQSSYIDNIVVTSDDDEVLRIAQNYRVEIVRRPTVLASDTATTFDAVHHTLSQMKGYQYTVLLQPTSPLRRAAHIDEAIEVLDEKSADAVVGVCEMEHSPLWSSTLPEDDSMQDFLREDIAGKRSQDIEKYYRINGAIYICDTKKMLEEKRFLLRNNTFAYKMSRENSIDIDEKIDFRLAEMYLKEQK